MIDLSSKNLLKSAHDCAEGGLAVALAESCIGVRGHEVGAVVKVSASGLSGEALLFSESQSRVVISVDPAHLAEAENAINSFKYPYEVIGKVAGFELKINDLVNVTTPVLTNTWRNSIGKRMTK